MQFLLLFLLSWSAIAMLFVYLFKRWEKKQRVLEDLKLDVWKMENKIRYCASYSSTLDLPDDINNFRKRWEGRRFIKNSLLENSYSRLIHLMTEKQDKYLQILIGNRDYMED